MSIVVATVGFTILLVGLVYFLRPTGRVKSGSHWPGLLILLLGLIITGSSDGVRAPSPDALILMARCIFMGVALWATYGLTGKILHLAGAKKHVIAIMLACWAFGFLLVTTDFAPRHAEIEAASEKQKIEDAAAKIERDKADAEKKQKQEAQALVTEIRDSVALACQKAVKTGLAAPNSASFSMWKEQFMLDEHGQWVMSNQFTAKNLYGVELDRTYLCVTVVDTASRKFIVTIKKLDIY